MATIVLPPARQKPRSFAQEVVGGLVDAAPGALEKYRQLTEMKRQKEQQERFLNEENQSLQQQGIDISGIHDPKLRQQYVNAQLQGKNRLAVEDVRQKRAEDFLNKFTGRQENKSIPSQIEDSLESTQQGYNPLQFTDEDILQLSNINPTMGRIAQEQRTQAENRLREEEKRDRTKFESDRAFHTGLAKKAIEEADNLRDSIPKKSMALDLARNAVETGDLNFFSPDKLADATGFDLFRTAKGAQLITAGKENLLSNLSKTSARAQNIWFEQRLNSMFPKIGQSQEANLTVQEMLEGENALDKAYLDEFDRLSEQDNKKDGFVSGDIKKRARSAVKPLEKEIANRTFYRLREIEEDEMGLSKMKGQVGKNVVKGTPLTLAMAKLYKEKFGEKALQVAEKNGYSVPTLEDFRKYRERPKEFRENISNE